MICPVRYFYFGGLFMKSSKTVRALVESAMMVALATVLSLLKIIEMPYGGSVTVGSMLPMIILAYRYGLGWGFGAGVVYATLQQLLGLNTLSYVTGWQSIVAVILLDYIVAFTVVGLGGIFRRVVKKQQTALALGSVLVSILRYTCHVISGCTVWAGLSIPDNAAFVYSLSYNLTYMLPEAIILVALAYYTLVATMIGASSCTNACWLAVRVAALLKSKEVPLYALGRGDGLRAAADAYVRFLLGVAAGEEEAKLCGLLKKADSRLEAEYEKNGKDDNGQRGS